MYLKNFLEELNNIEVHHESAIAEVESNLSTKLKA